MTRSKKNIFGGKKYGGLGIQGVKIPDILWKKN